MRRFFFLPALPALGCTPIDTSCPTAFAASFAAYVAEKVPLDTKSDCAGASRVPLNNPMSIGDAPAPPMCDLDPNGTACGACLVAACCAATIAGCADAESPVACWQGAPAVRACYVGAALASCVAVCNPGGGGS